MSSSELGEVGIDGKRYHYLPLHSWEENRKFDEWRVFQCVVAESGS